MARFNLPIIEELVREAAGYCKCSPRVLYLVDKDNAIALAKSLDVSAASGDVVEKLTLQDISLFAAAISPCVAGTCNREAIEGWFTDYLTDSEKGMAKQLQDFLRPWKHGFSNIESSFDQTSNDIGQVKDQFGTVEQSIEDVVKSFCSNTTACAETAVSELQFKDTIDFRSEITSAVDDTKELVTIVTHDINDFETLGDPGITTIVDKVINKEISSIKQLVDLLQAANKLPNIIVSLSQNCAES
ncbi:hypothetical protein DID88_003959 [Monilinia fructigena]|uniref:Uncharacterized protein n=1 Tax=Monilinia fructigena TaxID=38457 RepID=A0A395IJM3_9HELO|nr:hypothetical protein DID88_003959 [Monilinia fructigena]